MQYPVVIQGGMGVAVSNWRLARAVAKCGQLGVVSGTALDQVVLRRLLASSSDAAQLATELPQQLRRLLRAGEAGDLQLRLTSEDLQALGVRAERTGNRIAVALVAAAAIEAGATLLAAQRRRPHRRRRRH